MDTDARSSEDCAETSTADRATPRERFRRWVEGHRIITIGVITYALAAILLASMASGLIAIIPNKILLHGPGRGLTDNRDVAVTLRRKADASRGITFNIMSKHPLRFTVLVINPNGLMSFGEGNTHQDVSGTHSSQPSAGPFVGSVFVNATSEEETKATCEVYSTKGWYYLFEMTLKLQGSVLHQVTEVPMALVKKKPTEDGTSCKCRSKPFPVAWMPAMIPVILVMIISGISFCM